MQFVRRQKRDKISIFSLHLLLTDYKTLGPKEYVLQKHILIKSFVHSGQKCHGWACITLLTLSFLWMSDSVALAVAAMTCFSLLSSVISPRSSSICPLSSLSLWHKAAFWSLVSFKDEANILFLFLRPVRSSVLLLNELLLFPILEP